MASLNAIFIFGDWLRVRYSSISQSLPESDTIGLRDSELWIGGNTKTVFGLLGKSGPSIAHVTRDEGLVRQAKTTLPQVKSEQLDLSRPGLALLIQAANHCWGEWLSNQPLKVDDIAFQCTELRLPSESGSCVRHLWMPKLGNVEADLKYPPFRPNAGFTEHAICLTIESRGIVKRSISYGEVIEPLCGAGDAALNALDEALEAMFALLREDDIFGTNVYGQGWATGESYDLALAAVPRPKRSPCVCWVDTYSQAQTMRENAAYEIFSGAGMLEDYHDRVDIHALPLAEPIESTSVFFTGPASKMSWIADRILACAEAVALNCTWNGDTNRAIVVSLDLDILESR